MDFTSRALDESAYRRDVLLDFIRPGKPTEDGSIESFNGKLRDECLNAHEFLSIDDAWWADYNLHRPRSALGNVSPVAYLQKVKTRTERPRISNYRRT